MAKKIIVSFLLAAALALAFCACEATPDQVKAEEETVTLENINWTIAVEGGSADSYTIADAKAHDLTKITTSVFTKIVGGDNVKASQTSFIIQGVSLKDFLADMGKSDAKTVHYYGTDSYGEAMDYELTADDMAKPEKVVIGWIANKTSTINYSANHVGMFFDSASSATGCISVDKIVIS